ncbi:hypothetical protein FVB32_14410 [Flagellimonas hymeniacidonis]|uniref:Uncharacterized protein n=1 Tax=Flagellimonas hymeniacidonis TaxID=2603628 RepID=A0A5C8V366_9FLAO|nr:hypothetical protein [Flagellimonas hymeniacidonis]TXN35761.1 hypothetical protein FVB32_14410 [Flagellimonas hymeniacidonis]
MGTRELLTYLEKLEIGLSSFSYEELGTVEAGKLKRSFDDFKTGLEDQVFGVPQMEQLEVIYEDVGIQSPPKEIKEEHNDSQLFTSLIELLEKTELTEKQKNIVKELKTTARHEYMSNKKRLTETEKENQPMSSNTLLIEKNLESFLSTHKVNLKPVLTECMGQMELLEELVRLYKQNILEFIGSLKVQLQAKNFRGIDFACQKIQPCLRMMKTVSLLEITNQMITVCKTDNDIKYLNFLYNQFLVEYPKVEELVDFEIDVLRNM